MIPYNEREVLKLLQEESTQRKGFEMIVGQYSEQLYWQIRRMVLSHEDANDLLQNTFIKAWTNIDYFRAEAKLSTWLYRIALNECLTFLNKQRAMTTVDIDDPEAVVVQKLESDAYFSGDKIQMCLQKALQTLPEKQRMVFNLKYYQEMKYEEMSEIFGTSVGALKASYHHAVKKVEESKNSADTSNVMYPGDVTIDYPPRINNAVNNSVVSEKSKDEMSLDEYKQWVMNQISQFHVSGWVRSTFSSGSIVIKEEAFERMKNDPEYENYVLNRVRSAYSVQGLPVGSNNVSFDVIGASPEECYGYAGPVGKSGSETANDGESWWEKRHERMEELMKEQEKEAVKRAQARRKAVQNEYLNSQLAAAAYEKSSIILPDNPVIQ